MGNGERRKTAVTQVVVQDEHDPDYEALTVHIGIFTWIVDKHETKLYRHFMRNPNGTVVEVFGGLKGLKNESRLWLDHEIREASGTLADFLEGRLGDAGSTLVAKGNQLNQRKSTLR